MLDQKDIGMGFRVLKSHIENGVQVFDETELLYISVAKKGLEDAGIDTSKLQKIDLTQ